MDKGLTDPLPGYKFQAGDIVNILYGFHLKFFFFILFLLNFEYIFVKQVLQCFVGVIDAELL
jgi:hypothetical protein